MNALEELKNAIIDHSFDVLNKLDEVIETCLKQFWLSYFKEDIEVSYLHRSETVAITQNPGDPFNPLRIYHCGVLVARIILNEEKDGLCTIAVSAQLEPMY